MRNPPKATKAERAAWSTHLASLLPPSPVGVGARIIIPGKLPSKANTYEVRVDPTLWRQIRPIVEQWRAATGNRPWWIGPSQIAIDYQALAASQIAANEHFRFEGPLALHVDLYGVGNDIDNIKIIGDSYQASGIIKNDRQVMLLQVVKHAAEEPPHRNVHTKGHSR